MERRSLMKLAEFREITGQIIVKTGLRIGAGDVEMHIGGLDNPVIKHPHTLEPYIPGSSLKGKTRALLELESGLMGSTGGSPVSFKTLSNLTDNDDANGGLRDRCKMILKLFGSSGADMQEESGLGPTRASFSDCPLTEQWKTDCIERHLPYTEVKSEVAIDRIKGTAGGGGPRNMERVVAGATFTFCITLKVFEGDSDLDSFLLRGLKLLQMDCLGGSGSRGYGRLEFRFDDPEIKKKFDGLELK
jgi:CRISPR-associated protein Csm3